MLLAILFFMNEQKTHVGRLSVHSLKSGERNLYSICIINESTNQHIHQSPFKIVREILKKIVGEFFRIFFIYLLLFYFYRLINTIVT